MRRLLTILIMTTALCFAADISGTWNVTVEIQGNTGTPTFVLKQDGENLTGTYSGMLGEAPITGSIRSDQVEWSFDVKSDQVTGKITYKGTVTGNKMKGTASFGDAGTATWEGVKK